eukprot:8047727-Pyramimonas_sp.AAC.1
MRRTARRGRSSPAGPHPSRAPVEGRESSMSTHSRAASQLGGRRRGPIEPLQRLVRCIAAAAGTGLPTRTCTRAFARTRPRMAND